MKKFLKHALTNFVIYALFSIVLDLIKNSTIEWFDILITSIIFSLISSCIQYDFEFRK